MYVWIFVFDRAYVYISFVLLLSWLSKFVLLWSNFLNLDCVSMCMFHFVRLNVSVCNYATRNVFLLKINDNYKSFDFMTNGRRFNIKTSFFSNIKINLYFIKMDLCIFILDVKEWHFILLIINDKYKSFDFMTNGRSFNIKNTFFSNIKIYLCCTKMDCCIFILDVKR